MIPVYEKLLGVPELLNPKVKPLGQVRLNKGHWMYPYIETFCILQAGKFFDLKSQLEITNQSSVFGTAISGGIVAEKTAFESDSGLVLPVYPPTGSSNRFFIIECLFTDVPNSTPEQNIFSYGDNDAGERWSFKITAAGLYRIEIQGSGYTTSLGAGLNVWNVLGCSLDGTTLGDHTIYRNFVSESTSGAGTVNTASNDLATVFGQNHPGISNNTGCEGQIRWFGMFNSANAEIFRALRDNPYQILESVSHYWTPEIAAVGGVTGKSNPLFGPFGGPLVGPIG